MKKIFFFLFLQIPLWSIGQVTVDASLGANEYGTSNGFNYSNGTPSWYMYWDATYVYVLLDNANETEGAIIYFDFDNHKNPLSGNGLSTGVTHSSMTPNLPFNADANVYCHNSYRRIDRVNSGSWANVHTPGANGFHGSADDYVQGFYKVDTKGNGSGSDDLREFKIRWNDLTNGAGKPDSFQFVGWVNYSSGMYGEIPVDNPNGSSQPSTPDIEWYFQTNSTAASPSNTPFTNASFTMRDASATAFNNITTHHFTMARSGKVVTRNPAVGPDKTWIINGNLCVAEGEINLGVAINGNHCTVAGDVVIESSGTLKLSTGTSDLNIGGHFINNGTFQPNGSIVKFTGTTDQCIEGKFDMQTGNVNHFNQLEVDKSSGKLLLKDTAMIYYNTGSMVGNLKFTNGSIYLDISNLILDSSSTIISASSSKFVVTDSTGRLEKKYSKAGSFIYPVGTSGEYSPMTLDFTALSGSTVAGVRVVDSIHPHLLGSPTSYIDRFWKVRESGASSFSCDVSVTYVTADVHGTESNMYCGKYDGIWLLGNIVNALTNTLTYDGVTSFSDFTGAEPAVLPVKLLGFLGKRKFNGSVDISWTTAQEKNTSHFNLYQSLDGEKWIPIHTENARGGNVTQDYKFNFVDELSEASYFKIEAVDYDGASESFSMIYIAFNLESVNFLYSPGDAQLKVQITSISDLSEIASRVIDLNGVDMSSLVVSSQDDKTITFDLQSLKPSIYVVEVYGANKKYTYKLPVLAR